MIDYFDCHCPTCGRYHRTLEPHGPHVTISRTQHEALMAAVRCLCHAQQAKLIEDTLAALRAAGIQIERD